MYHNFQNIYGFRKSNIGISGIKIEELLYWEADVLLVDCLIKEKLGYLP